MSSKLEKLKELRELVNLEVRGLENYPIGEPNILIANHNCLMDIFYLPMSLEENIVSLISSRLIYKNEIERKQMVEKYLYSMPIEAHGGSIYSEMCLKYATELVCNGISVSIFPEGAYLSENIIHRGRTGASRILYSARERGIRPNLIPVSIDIKSDNLDLDSYHPLDDNVIVTITEPINYENDYYNYLNANTTEEKNVCLHKPIDEGMINISKSLNIQYSDDYIELWPKNNVIFENGITVPTSDAQSENYIFLYEKELAKRTRQLINIRK